MENEMIIKIISMPRLTWYFEYCKKNNASNTFGVFDVYNYNCLISSKLYVIIHNFEVFFRNFCYEKIKNFFHNEKWYLDKNILKITETNTRDNVIREFNSICERYKISKKLHEYPKIKDLSCSNFISNTNFGFWVRLFDSDRAYDIYNKVFASYFYKHELTRKKIRSMLDNIRFIRNRIAHNECIIKYDYKLTYHYIVDILFGLIGDKIYDAIISPIDNFTHINSQFEAGTPISDLKLNI
jgi:hypothetical protein